MNRLLTWVGLLALLLYCAVPPVDISAQQPKKKWTDKPADYGIKSKKALDHYRNGLIAIGYRGYAEGAHYMQQAVALEPKFAEAWQRLSACQYQIKKLPEAAASAQRALALQPKKFPETHFYIAEYAFEQQDYAEAAKRYKQYLSLASGGHYTAQAQAQLAKAEFAAHGNTVRFEPVNMGPNINTIGHEYMPCLTADDRTLFFTSRREGNTGGFDISMGDFDEDIFRSDFRDGAWQPAVNLGPPVNTKHNEGAINFSPDGRWVYYTIVDAPGGFGSGDIYVSSYDGQNWGEPNNLGFPINTQAFESQPCLSHDGRFLYFVSTRDGGLGGSDIWVSERVNGKWQAPKNLGPQINTPGDEYYPFLHADGQTLYFASDHHPGFGKQDMFMSTRQSDGSWSAPVNLGTPLNSPQDERGIFINARGTTGYISSVRPEGIGQYDLYQFALDPKIRPLPATFVRGVVLDSLSGKPVPEAVVSLLDLRTGDTVRQVRSDKQGIFLLSLPLGFDYAAFVDQQGFLFYSQNFSLTGIQDDQLYFDLSIRLQRPKPGNVVVLNNVFFDFDKADLLAASNLELDKLVDFLRKLPDVRVELRGHTDSDGDDAYNLELSQRRAEAVRQYLVSKGIAATRLMAKGYGESKPIATNDTPEGRAQNRRTEFMILE